MLPKLDKLFAYLESEHLMDKGLQTALNSIIPHMKHREFTKKTVFAHAEQIATQVCFLESGFANAYRIQHGKRIATWFQGKPGSLIPDAFFARERSREEIVIHPGSWVLVTSRVGMEKLFKIYPKAYPLMLKAQENRIRELEAEKMMLRECSSRKKFQLLLQLYPEILLYMTKKDIGNYIGVQPRQLYNIQKSLEKS